MTKEWNPETVFDVLGSDVAREILTATSKRPLSAPALADRCGVSEPTIYRRIDALQDYDLLDQEREIGDDGHHYHRYAASLEAARIRLEDGEFEIDLATETADTEDSDALSA